MESSNSASRRDKRTDALEAKNVLLTEDITERKRTEEILKKSEERYRTIFENASEGIFQTSIQGQLLQANLALAKMFGFASPGEMIASITDLGTQLYACSEDRERLRRLIAEHDLVENFEAEGRTKDGQSIWVSINIHAVRDQNGAILYLEGTNIDITARKQMEHELRQSKDDLEAKNVQLKEEITERKRTEEALVAANRKFTEVINKLDALVYVVDMESYEVLFINQHGHKLFGDIEGQLCWRTIQKGQSGPCEFCTNDKLIGPDGNPNDGVVWEFQNTVNERWYECRDRAILWSDGRIVRMEIATDITANKRAKEALLESEARYRRIVETANEGIMMMDSQFRYAFVNQKLADMLGYLPEEMLGRPVTSFIFEEDLPDHQTKMEKRVSGVRAQYARRHRRKDGSTCWTVVSATALKDDAGQFTGSFAMLTDITELKLIEEKLKEAHDELELKVKERTVELEARNAEMERFVHTVSHELRTPLVSIGGLLGFLKQDAQKGDMDRMIIDHQMAINALSKMDQLLGETLQLSRVGRVANPSANVPFSKIVKEALDQTTEKLKSKCIEVSVAEKWPIAHVDRTRLIEVLVNLIENSMKYMGDQAHPKIEIGHRNDKKETVFFVRDNGVGIDPSQHEKVFGLFYRLDQKSEGTAVGLAIVKRIIEVHGGRIWIESELGKGCTVCFTLALTRVG